MQIQYASQVARRPSQQPLHADVPETHSAFGHQSAANNIRRPFARQVTRQASHRSLYESINRSLRTGSSGDSQIELFRPFSPRTISSDVNSGELPRINLQSGTMMGRADFNRQNPPRQIALHENTASRPFGTYPEFPRTSFLSQQNSAFSQLNTAIRQYQEVLVLFQEVLFLPYLEVLVLVVAQTIGVLFLLQYTIRVDTILIPPCH
uniref:Uncharacterized protein n=1 Tax=Leersia perrieri TaxID=77586 RepID=A0A0D9Y0Q3_9ORYZ